MSSGRRPPGKLGYVSGPVDARGIYESWKAASATELFGTSYVRHFMQYCEDSGVDGVIITSHGEENYEATLGRFRIINRPQGKRGSIFFHLDSISWLYRQLRTLHSAGCDVVILTAAQFSWFVSILFRARGMRFINSYHSSLRPLKHRSLSYNALFIWLTSQFHLRFGDPTMVISPTIIDALRDEPGAKTREVFQIVPDYPEADFESFEVPRIAVERQSAVHILFAGRIEENKGVFDMVKAAEILNSASDTEFHFHFHGTGDASQRLQAEAQRSSASAFLHIHGFTAGKALLEHYRSADIVVVPTQSHLEEGFAKSVVEGVLALRPTVTSKACPAFRLLEDACVEARMDDPSSYAEKILELSRNPELAREKASNARELRQMFFRQDRTYYRTLSAARAAVR